MKHVIFAGLCAIALAGCNLDSAWTQYCAQRDGGCDGGTVDAGAVDAGGDAGTGDAGVLEPDDGGLILSRVVLGDPNVELQQDPHSSGLADATDGVAVRDAQVAKLWAYLLNGTTAHTLTLALYSSGAGAPYQLLGQTTVSNVAGEGWYGAALTPPVAITRGTTYWIAIVAPVDGTTGFVFPYGSGSNFAARTTVHSAQSDLTTFPATWSFGQSFPSTESSFCATE